MHLFRSAIFDQRQFMSFRSDLLKVIAKFHVLCKKGQEYRYRLGERRKAGSIEFGRLVAAITTVARALRPSIGLDCGYFIGRT
jgi:hypothetical protein